MIKETRQRKVKKHRQPRPEEIKKAIRAVKKVVKKATRLPPRKKRIINKIKKKDPNPLEELHEFNPKWARFVEEYMVDFIGAAAAKRVGYAKVSARKTAWELLHFEPLVIAAIIYLKKILSEETKTTKESIRMELEQTRRLAMAEGNLPTALQCTIWKGKTIGSFEDKMRIVGHVTFIIEK